MSAYRDDLQAALLRASAAERALADSAEEKVEKKVASAPSRLRAWCSRHWGDVAFWSVIAAAVSLMVALIVGIALDGERAGRERAACDAKRAALVDRRVDAYVRDVAPGGTAVGRHCAHGESFTRDGRGYVPCSVTVIPRGQSAPLLVDLWCSSSCDEGRGCRTAEARR